MAKKESTGLVKKDWVQRFNIVGEAKINDFTFKLEEHSTKSDWIYNSLNLGVDCGEKYGVCHSELMGGYGMGRENIVYVHGKKEDGTDDFENSYTIAWEDRFDESILADIGDLCFLTVGLEKDTKDKTFYKKFLTPYDAIAYVNENLTDGMVINVSGNLRYTVYNDTIQCRKEINSIALSSATPDKYHASFTQTVLLDKDSVTKDSFDKDTMTLTVDAYVIEKFKEFNGWDLTDGGKIKSGQFVPLRKQFEFAVKEDQLAKMSKLIEKLFKVKKGVTQASFLGAFVENGASQQMRLEDLPEDIQDLVSIGVFSEEEAISRCSVNGNRERKMVIEQPMIKMVESKDGIKTPVVQRFNEVFEEGDLTPYFMTKNDNEDEDTETEVEETVEEATDDNADFDMSDFLDSL